MICSWWICPISCFLLHYCEASHFNWPNYTLIECFEAECKELHSKDRDKGRNYLYDNSECVHFFAETQRIQSRYCEASQGVAEKDILTYTWHDE